MSFTPEPGSPLRAYYAQTQPRIGAVLSRRSLGTLDAVTIGRYAMTIGASDPSHYDPAGRTVGRVRRRRGATEHARRDRRVGYRHPEAASARRTPHDGDMPLGDGDLGLRVMGAGEEMELVNPVVRGPRWCSRRPSSRSLPSRPGPARACSSPPSHLQDRRRCRSQPNRRTVLLRPVRSPDVQHVSGRRRASAAQAHGYPFQLFRYSASPGTRTASTSTSPMHARRATTVSRCTPTWAALALRCVTEGLGDEWQVAKVAYRLRKPSMRRRSYTARGDGGRGRHHDAC